VAVLYHHIDSANDSDYQVTQEPKLPDDLDFVFGKKFKGKVPRPLVFEVNYPTRNDVPHFIGETIPVFSDSLIKVFRSAGVDNFQTFPALLRNPETGAEWDRFSVFHEFGLIAAADFDKSEYDMIMEGDPEGVSTPLAGFHVLVLDKKKTRNVAMFRLAESPDTLLIHTHVLQHIRKHRPPDGWGFDATDIEVV
jgi:hypothetical protein